MAALAEEKVVVNEEVTVPHEKVSRAAALAKRFLQTVVLLDDELMLTAPAAATLVTTSNEPGTKQENSVADAGEGEVSSTTRRTRKGKETLVTPPSTTVPASSIDAESLTESFAGLGLVCSVMRPQKSNQEVVFERTVKLARRSDVLILDWQMNKDEGAGASAIIASILKEETRDNRRALRLIVIYTSLHNFGEITGKIASTVRNEVGIVLKTEKPTVLTDGMMRILVLQKPGGAAPPKGMEAVNTDDLPRRVVDEFTAMTSGLIPGLAVASLAALRENAHELLGRLHKDLDPPYLAHRALLPYPVDAERHMLALVIGEITSILDQSDVSATIDEEAIRDWMTANLATRKLYGLFQNQGSPMTNDTLPATAIDDLVRLLTIGYENPDGESDKLPTTLRKAPKNKAHTICEADWFAVEGGNKGEDLDNELAMLTEMRTRYTRTCPRMELGQVLVEEIWNDEKLEYIFRICVQPKCDSVRIPRENGNGRRRFLFVRCKTVKTKKDGHDYVVRYGAGGFRHLKAILKPQSCEFFEFETRDKGAVEAATEGNRLVFNAVSGEKLVWVAEMRPEYAQELANNLATNLSRVALDQTEWLRRYRGSV